METILAKIKFYLPQQLYIVLQKPYHFALAYFAVLIFGFPSRKLIVIGVTGTKGKTTAVHLLHDILESQGAKAASVSSLRFRIGSREEPNTLKMTMPGRFFLQRFLSRAARQGCKYAVIEVTSQGIVQYRHRFIRFSGAVATNAAPEHIEAHGGFENYLRAKLDLFWRLDRDAIAIVNRDEAYGPRFAAATRAHRAWFGRSGIRANGKEWKIWRIRVKKDGIAFTLAGREFNSPLVGEFNLYNLLAGIAVGLTQGMRIEKIAESVARFRGVPGRMEFVVRDPFAVVVDYAHTPDSLRGVYTFLRGLADRQPSAAKLICVLGSAGGGRDRWKRPEMGKIAAAYCDEIILTDEDPYDENPDAILNDIASGFSQPPTANRQPPTSRKILDRRQAIREALRLAAPGDTVVITGKGAEPWMMKANGTKVSWDDREVAREGLEKIHSSVAENG